MNDGVLLVDSGIKEGGVAGFGGEKRQDNGWRVGNHRTGYLVAFMKED